MIKSLVLILSLFLTAVPAHAAKRVATPECPYTGHATCSDGIDNDQDNTVDEAAPSAAFSTVTGGYAANLKDCQFVTPYATAADTGADSGTKLTKTGNYTSGRVACTGNFTNGTYYLWARIKASSCTTSGDCGVWTSLSAVPGGFQNDDGHAPIPTDIIGAWVWTQVGKGYNFALQEPSIAQKTFSLNGDGTIYLVTGKDLDLDCLFLSTTSNASPTCPDAPLNINITMSGNGGGTVTCTNTAISCTGPPNAGTCSDTVSSGTTVSCSGTPDAGSDDTLWSGDCTGADPCDFGSVTSDKNSTAAFALTATPTPLWKYDVETSPLVTAWTDPERWSSCQSGVTRQTENPKNGLYSSRHNADPSSGNIQTGKCIRDKLPTIYPPNGVTEAYYSHWVYISSGGAGFPDPGNWQIWTTWWQLKNSNSASFQDASPAVDVTNPHVALSGRYGIPGDPSGRLFRFLLGVSDGAKWDAAGVDIDFPTTHFDDAVVGQKGISGEVGKWANFNFQIPRDTWFHLEVYVKEATTNGIIRVWVGVPGQGITQIFELSDPLLNTLKGWNATAGAWTTNLYQYHVMGNYLSASQPPGVYTMYLDDSRISTTRIGPTLPEFP